VDLATVVGAGAAGGLAGGLVAIGARLQSGFELLAERAGLDDLLHDAALCITGEGRLDAGSFSGKVVGGVYRWASEMGVPVVAVVGVIADDVGRPDDLEVRSLVEIYGRDRALGETSVLVAEQVAEILSARFLPSDVGRD
jgi:glycerate kinase